MADEASWTAIARLIKPQGRHGEVLAEILTDFPERFRTLHSAFLAREQGPAAVPVQIERCWFHKGRVVLKLQGIDSISAAETLRAAELVIPRSFRVPLDSESAYIADIVGCDLFDSSGTDCRLIGTVRDVIRQPGTADLLVVEGEDGTEHWIPFARAYLSHIDLPGRRLEMALPAGLLEINAPVTEEERAAQGGDENEEHAPADERRAPR